MTILLSRLYIGTPAFSTEGHVKKLKNDRRNFFSKIRRFQTANRILMFENTSPTLLDTQDVFRIRF